MSRTIAVLGATGGIGQAICDRLAGAGDGLMLFGRDEEKLRLLLGRLSSLAAINIRSQRIDFESDEDLRRFATEQKGSLPRLSGLVVIYPRIPKQKQAVPDPDTNLRLWQCCFLRPLELVRLLLDQVDEGGRVAIISGISNTQVFPSLGPSNVIRAAWLAQAKVLAFAFGHRRIRVNTISLGGTLTDRFVENALRSPMEGPLDDHPGVIPLGEYGDPRDAARVIEAMLGEFSNHMTGTNVVCDGGLSRHYG
jgi:3-oxoacyl-[acyl-carrier protein] reductase